VNRPAIAECGEFFRCETRDKLAIDEGGRTERAIAEAINGFKGDGAVGTGGVDRELMFAGGVIDERLAPDGLTGFGAAELDDAAA
jgi:hypothetical protein